MSENKKLSIAVGVVFFSAACLWISAFVQEKIEESRALELAGLGSESGQEEWAEDVMSWMRPSGE